MAVATAQKSSRQEANKIRPEDRPIHEWYRFVLSFPPHLVRHYVQHFELDESKRVLDPFCGTGTTLVECKKQGIPSVGVEAHPMAHLASSVKVDWSPDPDRLLKNASAIAERALATLEDQGIADETLPLLQGKNGRRQASRYQLRSLSPEIRKLLLTDSISPRPLHKTLVLLEALNEKSRDQFRKHQLLALAKALVFSISNLHFGPEVGVGPAKVDASVVGPWHSEVHSIATDLRDLRRRRGVPAEVHHADSRDLLKVLERRSIDAVITSPPYPNEKDYTRTTRLESVLLGFVGNKAELRALKRGLLRSNTRGVYKGDDDDQWVENHAEIQRIAQAIETRRLELGKTSGFERQYSRVTKLYFGGMARHFAELRSVLRPGALLGYVVGDQASYLRIMIRTGQLLADIAESLGYEVVGIDLFRTRLATATKQQMREEVVVLRWPGRRTSFRSSTPK